MPDASDDWDCCAGVETADGGGGGGGDRGPLSDLPQPHSRLHVAPILSLALDELCCVNGPTLLQLRALAHGVSSGQGLGAALRVASRRRAADAARCCHGGADLCGLGGGEWKQLNFAFACELPLYASLLLPPLLAIPTSDDTFVEAKRHIDLLSHFLPMPLSHVPPQSAMRSFCGGGAA